MADNETTADIIAWLRKPREGENAYLTLWRDEIADRLEAAHKRELSKNVSKNGADFGQLGDAAKLREALEFCVKGMCGFCRMDAEARGMTTECVNGCEALRKAKAALAAPPRNCDKYATADEALKAQEQMFNDSNFANGECKLGCPECDNPRVGCKIAWLYAPTTEQEGGAK